MLVLRLSRAEFGLFDLCSSVTERHALQKGVTPMRHRSIVDERQSMSNDDVSTRMHALKIAIQAAGALALGAFALGALLSVPWRLVGSRSVAREFDDLRSMNS